MERNTPSSSGVPPDEDDEDDDDDGDDVAIAPGDAKEEAEACPLGAGDLYAVNLPPSLTPEALVRVVAALPLGMCRW